MMGTLLMRIAAIAALLVILYTGEQYIEQRGADRQLAVDMAAINQQKAEAAALLANWTAKVHQVEQGFQELTNAQNIKDFDHEKTVADLSDRLRRIAGPAGRLRDPHAAGCGAGGSSTPSAAASAPGDRPADQPEAGGLLSADLSGLLQRITREADDINAAYASCRADAYAVRSRP
jgi:hypothetical protein